MKKILSLVMAGVMAASTCIVASAADTDTALAQSLAMVKQRLDIPEELSEFTYGVSKQGFVDVYNYTWTTGKNAEKYDMLYVTTYGNVITQISRSFNRWLDEPELADMTSAQLYSAAVKAVNKINPTIASFIRVDKESIYMNVNTRAAEFSLTRVKNGVPVKGDEGSIVLDKNTGELISFNINWHPKASFKSKSGVLSEDAAWEKYGELISIEPQYEIQYNWENDEYTTRLVYRQTEHGEINAFTGAKSDFVADAYYGETCEAVDEEAPAEDNSADKGFTENELKEITKDLPYGNEKAVRQILKTNEYLTSIDGMELTWDDLYKETRGGAENYIYSASFSMKEKEDYFGGDFITYPENGEMVEVELPADYSAFIFITVNAETGEVISYYLSDSLYGEADSYDMDKADKLAEKVFNSLAPSHVKEYSDYSSYESTAQAIQTINGKKVEKTLYYGSEHSYQRMANGIKVYGEGAQIGFDSNMRLIGYNINYTDVDFIPTDNMLTAEQIMAKFREKHDLELYYKARTGKTKTASVLVYGCDTTLYADAFTGEQLWSWTKQKNDLSGITDPSVLAKAKRLAENGIVLSSGSFNENTAVKQRDFSNLSRYFTEFGIYDSDMTLPSGRKFESSDAPLTRGDALSLYAAAQCGSKILSLQGIFKNPFTDISDSDPFLGCYAVAYAMDMVKGGELNPSADYTYGELINLVYSAMT